MSELTEVIDGLTGELERLREMHAETLIAHVDVLNRMAARIRELEAALREAMDLMHKDLAAYKSEMPSVTAEMEAFLDRYESDRGDEPRG